MSSRCSVLNDYRILETVKCALLVACMPLALCGCSTLWNAANRDAMARDMTEILRRHGVDGVRVNCTMIDKTRSGACYARLGPAQVTRLVSSLKLTPLASPLALTFEHCTDYPQAWRWTSTGPELRLANGGRFAHFDLLYKPDSGSACIEAGYAYG